MTPRTGNIKQRQDIRQTGIELLKKIHSAKILNADGSESKKNKYDRIILIGHSLGSVIAYDLIKFLWINYNEKIHLTKEQIEDIEESAKKLKEDSTKKNREEFREKQFELWKSQYQNPDSWRISDFITLGSPLAHAELLLAANPEQLTKKIIEREYPACPPIPEEGHKFHFRPPGTKTDLLHHGAVFALTRWTNVSYKQDYVGGNINCFGEGIENHSKWSESWLRNIIPFLSHVFYWDKKDTKVLKLIREKLRLRIKQDK
jgi:hypothetical protein